VEKGYKSITLLGQNVNSYGLDKKGNEVSFAALLDRIGRLGKESDRNFWVYFTSPHPRDMTEEVISVMARYDCLAKQVHLPLQSGDDKVLIRMNRNHNMDRYRRVVEHIRKTIPEATLFTDIIVGFTGESEEQLENTRKAIAEFRYNMAYIAMYSPRPGATSSRWTDDVPGEVKKARLHKLTEELRKHTSAYNNGLIGRTVRVLVTGPDRKEGFLTGHTEGRIIIRFPFEGTNLIGRFVDVRIGSASDFSAEGSLVGMKEHEMIGE
jgi:tRNA-2-methylthio-N6-dimethylallyladenosine synthase